MAQENNNNANLRAVLEASRLEEEARRVAAEQRELQEALETSARVTEAERERKFEENTASTTVTSLVEARRTAENNLKRALNEHVPADRRDAVVLLAELDGLLERHREGTGEGQWPRALRNKLIGVQKYLQEYIEKGEANISMKEREDVAALPDLILTEIYDAGLADPDEVEGDEVYQGVKAKRNALNQKNREKFEAEEAGRAAKLEKLLAKEAQARKVAEAKATLNAATAALEGNKGKAARYGGVVKNQAKKEQAIQNAQKAYNNAKAALNAMEGGRRRTKKTKKARKAKKGTRRH